MPVAMVTFWGADKGGRFSPPSSGFRPQVDLRGVHTSCVIESVDNEEVFSFEMEHRVLLKLMFPDQYPDAFKVGDAVSFYEGSKLIGSGRVIGD